MSSRGATKPSHWTSNLPIICPSYRAVLNFKHSTQPTCSGIFLSVMDFTPRLTWRDIDQFKFRSAWEGCKPQRPDAWRSSRHAFLISFTCNHSQHPHTPHMLLPEERLLRSSYAASGEEAPLMCLQGSVSQCWPHSPEHPSLGSNSRDTARAHRAVTGRYRRQRRVSVRSPMRTEGLLARKTMSMAPQAYMILPVMDPKCL